MRIATCTDWLAARRCTVLLGAAPTAIYRQWATGLAIRTYGSGAGGALGKAEDEPDGAGDHGIYTSPRAGTYVYTLAPVSGLRGVGANRQRRGGI
jgi:hypothetical protein